MASKNTPAGIIDPDLTYTLERLAVTLGTTPRHIREKYINTELLDAAPFGRSYLIPGQVFATFVLTLLESKDETRSDDQGKGD